LIAGWRDALVVHLEVDADALQRSVPFPLDLRNGRAFVSLVAFTIHGMRPRVGGAVTKWLFQPIATHEFLNFRTYVRCNGEPGIHFLAEWLSKRLATKLGPPLFSLPYRHARLDFGHDSDAGFCCGTVVDTETGGRLCYRAELEPDPKCVPSEAGSLDEWLMERYTAFNSAQRVRRLFRVWHPPWLLRSGEAVLEETTLLDREWPWFCDAKVVGCHYSPGFGEVWMGRPHPVCMVPA
jgi:uncharacterized protein YqjF (DUF2071 family)